MAIKRTVKKKQESQPIKRVVRKPAAMDVTEASPLAMKDMEDTQEDVNSDFAAAGETAVEADEYRLPVDHKKAIDDLLKSGNTLMNESDYQTFKNLNYDERVVFVDEWDKRRKKRKEEQKKSVEGL